MTEMKTQIDTVVYNAAEQCFEALVTFHTDAGRIRVAAQFEAPITTEFETAQLGLWQAALVSLDRPDTLQSRLNVPRSPTIVPPQRTTPTTPKTLLTRALRRLAA